MNKLRFIMKSGKSFTVLCENAKITSCEGELTQYSITGIKSNRPLYIRLDDVAAVIDEGRASEKEETHA